MQITLDPETEQRIQRELDRGPYRDPSELFTHALDLLRAEEDWLVQNREAIQGALEESMTAEANGESYSREEVEGMLNQRRAERTSTTA